MSTAGRSGKPDANRDSDSRDGQLPGGGRGQPDSRGAGPFGQRTRFLPLPQSAISSNHNQRGQSKSSTIVPLPSPSSAARARSQPQPPTQATKPSSVLPNETPTPPNGAAPATVSAWGKGNTVQRLSQQQQGQQQPAKTRPSYPSLSRPPSIPTSQRSDEAPGTTQAAPQAAPTSKTVHPSAVAPAAADGWAVGPAKPPASADGWAVDPAERGETARPTSEASTSSHASRSGANQTQSSKEQSQSRSSGGSAAAVVESQAQAGSAERADSGSAGNAQPQRSQRRRGSSRSASQQGLQPQQNAHQPERQERQYSAGAQNAQLAEAAQQQQQAPSHQQPQLQPQPQLQAQPQLPPQQPQLPPPQPQLPPPPQLQQPQQQQQQQRRGQGQVRNRDDAAARQMPRVNLGRAAAEGAAARPPSTPAASEPPRTFSGEVDQTPLGPGTPQERFPTPCTPTPATPHASEPGGGPGVQGPFAQQRPLSSFSQPDNPSSTPASDPQPQAAASHHQHSSLPNALVSAALSASAPSMSLTFGSVSLSDVGKPASLQPVGFSQPLLPLGQLASGHLETAPGIASEAGTGGATLPEASLPASASSSAQRLPQPQPQPQPSTESAPEFPVHARTDSVASTSSPGQSNHEGHRRRPSSASGRNSQGARRPTSHQAQQRSPTPSYYPQDPHWAAHQVQEQHQQQQFWNTAAGYEAMYGEAYPGYPGAAGQGWFNGQGYGDPGMYEHPGNQFWGPTQQAGYGYDGQSDYRHPPQQQPRGRGHRSRQPQPNSNAYYHGQSYVNQQTPSHLQQQQLPGQQHMSHQLPGGQQHVSQQGSRQSSQHVSSQSSPPMVARSHPQTQDLPRSLSQSSEQAQPNHAHAHPGQPQRQAPQNHPSYPSGPPARQTSLPSSAHPQAAPSQPQSYPLPDPYADPHSAAAPPELAAMYAQQQYPTLQTPFDGQQPAGSPFDGQQPAGLPNGTNPGVTEQDQRQYQQQLVHQQQGRQHSQPQPQLEQTSAQQPHAQQPHAQQPHAQQQSAAQSQRQQSQQESHPHEQQQRQQQVAAQQQPPPRPMRQQQQQQQQQQVPQNKQLSMQEAEARMQVQSSPAITQQSSQPKPAGQSGQPPAVERPATAQAAMPQPAESSQQLQQQPRPVSSSAHVVDTVRDASTTVGSQQSQSTRTAAAGAQGLSSSRPVPTSPTSAASEGPAARAEPTATPSPTEGSSSEQPSGPAPKAASSWASMVKAATTSPQPARRPSSTSRPQHAQQPAQAHTQPSGGAQRAQQPAQRQTFQETGQQAAAAREQQGPQPLEQAASGSVNGENAAQPAANASAGIDGSASAQAIQAASASAQSSLKAPSSLAVGAAMPSTKDSILAQSGSSQHPASSYPPKAPSSSTPPAAATAAASKSSKATAVSQPRESEVPKRSLKGFEEAVAQSVTALCQVEGAQEGSDQGIRLQPRGLKNSGNLCFMNSTLQALMAGASFCAFMDGLRAAAPALPPSDVPHLYNFSQLARCFPVQPQARAVPDQPQPQAQDRAVSEQPQAKADAEQPQAQDDSAAQPAVNGHEADEDKRSESRTDSEVMSVDGKAESVKSDAKPESKAAPKGSRASSWGPSSDGGVDHKAGKAVPKVASRSHLELAGPAVVPDMMYGTLDIFNPHNAKLLAATAAGQELTMAQRINRGVQKVAKQREQEDAQEFLTFLLDAIHQEQLKLRAMYGTEGSAANTSYDDNWNHVARKGKSNVTRGEEDVQGGRTLTSQIFGGALQSTVKAARAKASVTVQPFNLLHLDIQGVNNVPAALQMLTKPEDIHDYKATDQSAPVNAKKEIKLLRLPRILVLHMCRFTYGNQGLTKLHKQMQFSLKLRIQQSLLADDCEQRRHGGADYELIASVSHHGKTPASGHYTADVKQPDGEWLRFDDDFVSHVNVTQVLNRDCEMYLLFYELKPRT